jgi:FPC/CPF motif-containing protein YcgG
MNSLKEEFLKFVTNPQIPCLGARASAQKKQIKIILAKNLCSPENDNEILSVLYEFIEKWEQNKEHLQTVAVIFKYPQVMKETEFERNLLSRLHSLHLLDQQIYKWAPRV